MEPLLPTLGSSLCIRTRWVKVCSPQRSLYVRIVVSESEAIIDATCVGSVSLARLAARHSVEPLSVGWHLCCLGGRRLGLG